jgi:hypothetical protein
MFVSIAEINRTSTHLVHQLINVDVFEMLGKSNPRCKRIASWDFPNTKCRPFLKKFQLVTRPNTETVPDLLW